MNGVDTSSAGPGAAARYDRLMRGLERRFFADTRAWLGGRAVGEVLEIAIGTGLNLPHYPPHTQVSGVDHNEAALEFATARANRIGRLLNVKVGDALGLPFASASFDSVLCSFALCEVDDVDAALAEAVRMLRPGGRLLLADHVIATNPAVRLGQRILEAVTIPLSGEHFTRRPYDHLAAAGLAVVESERLASGAIERIHARIA